MKSLKDKNKKQALLSVLLFVVIIVLYMELNVIINKANIEKIDITENKTYSLSNDTISRISKIDKDVQIKLIDFENYTNYSAINDIVEIADKYPRINSKISVTMSSSETADENGALYPHLIIKTAENEQELTVDELFLYKYYTMWSYNDEYYISEEVLTNCILNVANNEAKKVYLLKDKMIYSEKYILSLATRIKNLGNNYGYLDFTKNTDIPNDCALIILPPVKEDLSDTEKVAIEKYINNGGNILFLEESKSLTQIETPNYDYIMSLYGFTISDGIILEKNNRVVEDNPGLIYTNINQDNEIFNNMKNHPAMSVMDSGVINIADTDKMNELGVTYKTLATSSQESYMRKDLTDSNLDKSENDVDTPNAVLGAYFTKKIGDKTSKAIVFSSSLFASDRPVYVKDFVTGKNVAVSLIYMNDNEEIITNSIKYLTENENTILARKKHYDTVPGIGLIKDGITLKIVFFIPVLIVFIGIMVWRHRKNKK
ncbi:MAG: Gldg family protein [Bacilli bacterium]|nr:Gldg family protein [Bacilli bacterium]